ncbi:hypothetical protein K502DRAFT_322582 [Neoconidiobolus thromboides FSU 785]|nr:hypothetical protein K502DRAFT_322582 [Neoconidiobolus thromboides FSU 785]
MPDSLLTYSHNINRSYYTHNPEYKLDNHTSQRDNSNPQDLESTYNKDNYTVYPTQNIQNLGYNIYADNLNQMYPHYLPGYVNNNDKQISHQYSNSVQNEVKTEEISPPIHSDYDINHNLKSTLSVPTPVLDNQHSPQNINRGFEMNSMPSRSLNYDVNAPYNLPLINSYNGMSQSSQFYSQSIFMNPYQVMQPASYPGLTNTIPMIKEPILPIPQKLHNEQPHSSDYNKKFNQIASSPTSTTRKRSGPLPKIIPCSHPGCEKKFSRLYNMKAHLEIHNPVRIKQFQCHICSRRFSRKHDLTRHIKVIHKAL